MIEDKGIFIWKEFLSDKIKKFKNDFVHCDEPLL